MPDPVVDRLTCVALIPGYGTPYGYDPSLATGIVFTVLYALSMIMHIFTSIRYRVWWQMVFAVGALTEVLGWAGRTWSSPCPYQTTPFLIQICTLILAPAFFTAGIYIILGRLIRTFGPHVSPLAPNTYLYIFCTVDIISLVIQAIGGGMAAVAFQMTPPGNTDNGTHIMVAGILFQLASIAVFSFLFTWVILKALRSHGEVLRQRKIQYIIAATVFAVIVIVIRSIYRTIELLQGWSGYLITTERYFIALDGAMMVLCVGVFNIVQPKWASTQNVLPESERETKDSGALETGEVSS